MALMQRTFRSWRRPWWQWRALADRRDRIADEVASIPAANLFVNSDWSGGPPPTSWPYQVAVTGTITPGTSAVSPLDTKLRIACTAQRVAIGQAGPAASIGQVYTFS